MEPIRTFVADGEPLARDEVRLRLERDPAFLVVGECARGPEAVDAILGLRPDLVILDAHLPGLSGFDVLAKVREGGACPTVVFVTETESDALRAFEAHALDCVLKPFTENRLCATLCRARERAAERRAGWITQRASALVRELSAHLGMPAPANHPARFAERLAVREADRVSFLPVDELEWVQADGDYVRLHCAGARSFLIRRTMAEMEKRLDPARFVRIHRSALVRLDRIRELRPAFKGDFAVVLADNQRLTLSRTYRKRLQGLLDDAL